MGVKPKLFLGTLLAGFLVLTGSAPAAAHGSHHPASSVDVAVVAHGSAGGVAPTDGAVAPQRAGKAHHLSDLAAAPQALAQPLHDGSCCCGGALCHASAAITIEVLSLPDHPGQRLEPPVAAVSAGRQPGGIDRPPRAMAL
jgi:hypothetical protein